MNIGGQILWNAFPICETFKISCLMGKLHAIDVLENHLKDQLSRLVLCLSITLSLRKTSQESISSERKSYLEYSLDTALYAGGIWKRDMMVADVEELETMDLLGNLRKKTQCKGSNISQRKWEFHISSRRWTNKNCRRKSGTEKTHLDTGSPNSRRRSKRFSRRIRRVSTSTTPQDSLPDSGEAINDFWSRSGYFIFRHHVEPRVKLYSPREESFPIPLKYIDVSRTTHTNLDVCKNAASMTIGISIDQEICLTLGQVSLDLLY